MTVGTAYKPTMVVVMDYYSKVKRKLVLYTYKVHKYNQCKASWNYIQFYGSGFQDSK